MIACAGGSPTLPRSPVHRRPRRVSSARKSGNERSDIGDLTVEDPDALTGREAAQFGCDLRTNGVDRISAERYGDGRQIKPVDDHVAGICRDARRNRRLQDGSGLCGRPGPLRPGSVAPRAAPRMSAPPIRSDVSRPLPWFNRCPRRPRLPAPLAGRSPVSAPRTEAAARSRRPRSRRVCRPPHWQAAPR